MTFSEIKKELENAPMTWVPALLVARAIREKVFGCKVSEFVETLETKQANLLTCGTNHGVDCRKVLHCCEGGYSFGWMHHADDDFPYFLNNVKYCGRCHQAL